MFNFFQCINKKNTTILRLSDLKFNNTNFNMLKERINIAVIDDSGFQQAQKLRNNNFKITEFPDISSLEIVANYPIIICDIHGVGKELSDSELGGAYLIKQLRIHYPDKYIVAYSTHSNDISLQNYIQYADLYAPKGTNFDEWIDILMNAIKIMSNPITRWKRFRSILLEKDMELYEILQLEQEYIKYFTSTDTQINLTNEISKIKIDSNFQAIINQFVSAGLVEITKNLMLSNLE